MSLCLPLRDDFFSVTAFMSESGELKYALFTVYNTERATMIPRNPIIRIGLDGKS